MRSNKLTPEENIDLVLDLVYAFSSVNNLVSAALLMQDLLTEEEVFQVSRRLRIAKLLIDGYTHDSIVRELKCSFGTVARVSSWLAQSGTGVTKLIKDLPKHKKAYRMRRGYHGYGLPQILIAAYYNSNYDSERKMIKSFIDSMAQKSEMLKFVQAELNREL